jgi:hypothetical protein
MCNQPVSVMDNLKSRPIIFDHFGFREIGQNILFGFQAVFSTTIFQATKLFLALAWFFEKTFNFLNKHFKRQKFYCKSVVYKGAIKNTSLLFWK